MEADHGIADGEGGDGCAGPGQDEAGRNSDGTICVAHTGGSVPPLSQSASRENSAIREIGVRDRRPTRCRGGGAND